MMERGQGVCYAAGMQLVQAVGRFTNADDGDFAGQRIMCHGASVYWLYNAEFSRPPSFREFTDKKLSPPDPIIASMLKFGRQLKNLTELNAVIPGTVLVFVENGMPKHSCVAIMNHSIAGYNQTGWFTSPGIGGDYDTHRTSEVTWLGKPHAGMVQGSNSTMHCNLLAIPEGTARACLREKVQG